MHVTLSRPRKDGSDLYSHLEQVASATGSWPKEYEPVPPPEGTEFIWETFWEIRNCSPIGFNGPGRITFADLDCWQRVRGFSLSNLVIDMFLQMDATYLEEWYRNKK